MKREEQIKAASSAYTRVKCPMAIGGDRFKNMIDSLNANPAFIAGAEWADNNPKSPWISVDEKLPDDGVLVIVAYRWILGEILYASDAYHIDYGWESYDDIVAWMPIPQLPKEDGV